LLLPCASKTNIVHPTLRSEWSFLPRRPRQSKDFGSLAQLLSGQAPEPGRDSEWIHSCFLWSHGPRAEPAISCRGIARTRPNIRASPPMAAGNERRRRRSAYVHRRVSARPGAEGRRLVHAPAGKPDKRTSAAPSVKDLLARAPDRDRTETDRHGNRLYTDILRMEPANIEALVLRGATLTHVGKRNSPWRISTRIERSIRIVLSLAATAATPFDHGQVQGNVSPIATFVLSRDKAD